MLRLPDVRRAGFGSNAQSVRGRLVSAADMLDERARRVSQRSVRARVCADGLFDGHQEEVRVAPERSPAANYGFDVTPRRLVTGLITERGICAADEKSIRELFPEHGS